MGDAKRRRALMGDDAYFSGNDTWNSMKMWRKFCQLLGVIGTLPRKGK